MLVHVAVRATVIISLAGTMTDSNILLYRGDVAIMVMVEGETGTVVTIMMFDQTRPSMNAPENQSDSYQQEGNASEHGGGLALQQSDRNGNWRHDMFVPGTINASLGMTETTAHEADIGLNFDHGLIVLGRKARIFFTP